LFLGYLALRRTGGPVGTRSKRSAIAGVLFAVVVPIDHFATQWWRTLHQGNTLMTTHPLIHGSQLATMLLSFLVFGLIYSWLLVHRFRLEQLEERLETDGLELALAARRSEGSPAAKSEPARAESTSVPALHAGEVQR
jgi:heme exporter protein C